MEGCLRNYAQAAIPVLTFSGKAERALPGPEASGYRSGILQYKVQGHTEDELKSQNGNPGNMRVHGPPVLKEATGL